MAPNENWVYDEETGEYFAPGTIEMPVGRSVLRTTYQSDSPGFFDSALGAADTVLGSIGTAAARFPASGARFFWSNPANFLESQLRSLPFETAQGAADVLGAFADRTNSQADQWDQAVLDRAGYDRGSTVDKAGGIASSLAPAAVTAPLGTLPFLGFAGVNSGGSLADTLEKNGATPGEQAIGGLIGGGLGAAAGAVNLPFLRTSANPLANSLKSQFIDAAKRVPGIVGTNLVVNPLQTVAEAGVENAFTDKGPSWSEIGDRAVESGKAALMSGVLPFMTPTLSGRPTFGSDSVNIDASAFDGAPIPDAASMGYPDPAPLSQDPAAVRDRAMAMVTDSVVNKMPDRMDLPPDIQQVFQQAEVKTSLPADGVALDQSGKVQKAIRQKSMPRPTDILVPPTGNVLEAYTPDVGPQRISIPRTKPSSSEIIIPGADSPAPDATIAIEGRPSPREVVTARDVKAKALAESIVRGNIPESVKKMPVINTQTMPRREMFLPKKELPAPQPFEMVGPVRTNPEVNPMGEKADFKQAQARQNYDKAMPVMESNFDAVTTGNPVVDPITGEQTLPMGNEPIDTALSQRKNFQQTRTRKGLLKAANAAEGSLGASKFEVKYPKYERKDSNVSALEDGSISTVDANGNVHQVSLDVDFVVGKSKMPGSKKAIEFSKAPRKEARWRVMDAGPDGLPVTIADKLTAKEAVKIGKFIVAEKAARAGQLAPGNAAAKVDPSVFEVPAKGFKGENLIDGEVAAKLEARDPKPRLRAKVLSGQRGVLNVGDIVDAITSPFQEMMAARRLRREGVKMASKDEAVRGWQWVRDAIGENAGTKATNYLRGLDQFNTWAERSPELKALKIAKENEPAIKHQVDYELMPNFRPMLELDASGRRRVSDAAHKVYDILLDKRTKDPSAKVSVDSISDAYLAKVGMAPDEIAALRGIWKGFDAALPHIADALKADAPDANLFPDEHAEFVQRVDAAIESMRGIGYVPRTRSGSQYLIKGKDASGSEVRFQFDSAKLAEDAVKDLRAMGADVTLSKMAKDAKTDWSIPNLSGEINNAISELALNKYKVAVDKGGRQDSFIKHLVAARNVKGYDADLTMPILNYVEGLGNFKARKVMAPVVKKILGTINPKGDEPGGSPELARRAQKYLDYVDSTTNPIANLASGFVDFYSLAGVTSSGVINLLQSQNTLALAFARGGLRGLKNALRSSRFSVTNDLKSVPESVRGVIDRALQTGVIDSGAFLDKARLTDNVLKKTNRLLMKTFSIPEAVTRRNAFLTGALIGHDAGLSGDALLQYSREFLSDTMGDYSKTNATAFEQSLPPGGGQLILKYKKYMINQMRLMRRLAANEGGRGKAALFGMLAAQVAIAGLAGLPGGKDAKRALEAAGGDPDKWAEELMKDPVKGRALMYGIPGQAFGVDLSASYGFGNIVPEGKGGLGETVASTLAGPLWQFKDRAARAYDMRNKDNPLRMAEQLLPRFARGPIREYELATTGSIRDAGKNSEISNAENSIPGLTALGFTPPSAREKYQERRDIQKIQQEANVDENEFNFRFAKALFENDNAKMQSVIDEMLKYNEKAIAEGKPWKVRRLDKESIKMRIAEMMGGDAALYATLKRTKKAARGAVADRAGED